MDKIKGTDTIMAQKQTQNQRQANTRLTVKLLFAVVAMFGFGYALVPLYDVMCEALGINGKTNTVAAPQPHGLTVDLSRTIEVELIAHIPTGMPLQLQPQQSSITVHPGQVIQTTYLIKNLSPTDMIAQAVPSVSPGLAAGYFNKMECFCFTHQPLKAGQSADLGLMFYIEPDIPDSIHTLTLAYTLFDIAESQATSVAKTATSENNQGDPNE